MNSTVYLAEVDDGASTGVQAEAVKKVLTATGFSESLRKLDMVAIKVHVGERNNTTHAKPELVAEAAQSATAELQPFSDVFGSGAYRKRVATAMVRRALTTAIDRAGGAL